MIEQGRVVVNGKAVQKLGSMIDEFSDQVAVDGRLVRADQEKTFLLLNKPAGFLVTLSDPFKRPEVLELLPRMRTRLFPVGRLDFESEGLLLMTNDGELAYRLTHPKFQVKKEYSVAVSGCPSKSLLSRLEKGIFIEGKKTAPAKITTLSESLKIGRYRIVIHEGRKREIRKMFAAIGHPVIHLRRTKFAGLTARGLKPGGWRHLTQNEVDSLKKMVRLKS